MPPDCLFTREEMQEALMEGHRLAAEFVRRNPTGSEIQKEITDKHRIAVRTAENFLPESYKSKNNISISESALRQMLLCSFKATQEVRELENLVLNSNSRSFKRAAYLDSEAMLPVAVSVFRSHGNNNEPDYNVIDIIEGFAHLRAG
jgi:hypothetical protein